MKGKKHTPEQIVARLREAEAQMNAGQTIEQVCQKLAISEQTFHRWRNQYGGMKSSAAKRLKALEEENRRLKQAVTDLTLVPIVPARVRPTRSWETAEPFASASVGAAR
jgi:transposase-like protein